MTTITVEDQTITAALKEKTPFVVGFVFYFMLKLIKIKR